MMHAEGQLHLVGGQSIPFTADLIVPKNIDVHKWLSRVLTNEDFVLVIQSNNKKFPNIAVPVRNVLYISWEERDD